MGRYFFEPYFCVEVIIKEIIFITVKVKINTKINCYLDLKITYFYNKVNIPYFNNRDIVVIKDNQDIKIQNISQYLNTLNNPINTLVNTLDIPFVVLLDVIYVNEVNNLQ